MKRELPLVNRDFLISNLPLILKSPGVLSLWPWVEELATELAKLKGGEE